MYIDHNPIDDIVLGSVDGQHFSTNFAFPPLGHFKPFVWFCIISVAGTMLTLGATEIVIRRVNIAQQRILIRALPWLETST